MTYNNVFTHRKDRIYCQPHFFILNKGNNSGKPLKEPCPNCFVITVKTDEEAENLYWIALSLWKSKLWHQYLIGSVIPFIRLNDFKSTFRNKVISIYKEHNKHLENVEKLNKFEDLKSIYNKNIDAIERIKAAILQYYI
ncbi:MAG: hypothetical protein H7Z76_02345 [Methylotenera sp.]|nr:hypothetical protein [Flavobacterium sp.]